MMTKDLSSEETTVVATYSNRHDAEVARGCLEDHDIASFIVADDVHPPFQLTEGVRLRVLNSEVQTARGALEDAAVLRERASGDKGQTEREDVSVDWPVRMTAWAYIVVFVFVVAVIIIGLLFSSIA